MIDDRIPPQTPEAEQAVLGSMLLDRAALTKAAALLSPDDFYTEAHRQLFEAIVAVNLANKPVDLVTLGGYLRDRGLLEKLGGMPRLAELMDATPTAESVEHYAREVKTKSVQRRVITAAHQILDEAYGYVGDDALGLASYARSHLDLATDQVHPEMVLLGKVAHATLTEARERAERGESLLGVSTGMPEMDRILGGLCPSRLIVVAGRSGRGKTSLALQWATYLALEGNIPTVFFSLEQSKEELSRKALALVSGVDSSRLQTGALGQGELDALTFAAERMESAPFYVFDQSRPPLATVMGLARLANLQYKAQVFFLDYVQRVVVPGQRERRLEVDEVVIALKSLARDLGVPVVALSQMTRPAGGDEYAEPELHQLRETGQIEQEADSVVFVHRGKEDWQGVVHLLVKKNRHGSLGSVDCLWDGGTQRMSERR